MFGKQLNKDLQACAEMLPLIGQAIFHLKWAFELVRW